MTKSGMDIITEALRLETAFASDPPQLPRWLLVLPPTR